MRPCPFQRPLSATLLLIALISLAACAGRVAGKETIRSDAESVRSEPAACDAVVMRLGRCEADPWIRANFLARLAASLARSGQAGRARLVFAEAVKAVRETLDRQAAEPDQSVEPEEEALLAADPALDVAGEMTAAGLAELARPLLLETVRDVREGRRAGLAPLLLARSALSLTEAGDPEAARDAFAQAVRAAEAEAGSGERVWALAAVIEAMVAAGPEFGDEAVAIKAANLAGGLADRHERAVVSLDLARLATEAGWRHTAQRALADAAAGARRVRNVGQADALFAEAARLAARQGDLDQALEWVSAVKKPEKRAEVRLRLALERQMAGARDQAGDLLQAAAAEAEGLTDPKSRAARLCLVVSEAEPLLGPGQAARLLAEALGAADLVADVKWKAFFEGILARALVLSGRTEEAWAVLALVQADWTRSLYARMLAHELGQANQREAAAVFLDRGPALALAVASSGRRDMELLHWVQELARAGRADAALVLARNQGLGAVSRVSALRAVGGELARQGRAPAALDVFLEALEAAGEVPGGPAGRDFQVRSLALDIVALPLDGAASSRSAVSLARFVACP